MELTRCVVVCWYMSGALVVHLCTIWQRGQAVLWLVLWLLVLRLSRRVHSGKWGFRVTAGQKFHKSKKGERSVHMINVAVSLDTETGF